MQRTDENRPKRSEDVTDGLRHSGQRRGSGVVSGAQAEQ